MTDELEYKSKSQRKREMHELQAMGVTLCDLPEDKIRALDIPAALRDAALESKAITKHEARRRHMQYMGKLMRAHADDIDALRDALAAADAMHRAADDEFHKIESWRDRLVAGDFDAIEDIAAQHPAVDRQHVLTLARNAARELAKDKPPKTKRALFRYLRDLAGA